MGSAPGARAPHGDVTLPPIPPQPPAPGAGSGCTRWFTAGCIAGLLVLVAMLVGGYWVLQRGLDLMVERARAQLMERLPHELGEAERARLREDLVDFFAAVEAADDPAPLTGEFLRRTGAALDDGRLTRTEVLELDAFLRAAAGKPPAGP